MAPIPGSVPVAGFFAPTDDTDTYAATDPKWAKGGFSNWNTLNEVLSFPAGRRELGMMVSLPASEWVSGAEGIVILKLINNPSGNTTTVADWEEFFSSKSVYDGDLTLYVDVNGSDSTGDGSQANPYATIERAYNSLPDVVTGDIHINLGAGSFDLPDLDTQKVCRYFYLDGHTTDLNNDVTFVRDSNGSMYDYVASVDFNYEGTFIARQSSLFRYIPVAKYDSATRKITLMDYNDYMITETFSTYSVDTTLVITGQLNINLASDKTYINNLKLDVGSHPFSLNTKYYYHNDLFITSFYVNTNKAIRITGSLRRGVIVNSANQYGLYTPNIKVRPNFYYSLALINTSGSSTKAGVKLVDNHFSGFYIEGYKYGFEMVSMSGFSPKYLDSYWNYALSFCNVDTAINIKSEGVSFNFESKSYFENVNNLLAVSDEAYLRGLKIRLNEYQGTLPTNLLDASFESYKLFDEQVVDKVVTPYGSSSDVLELTTAERNSLQTVYEGRIVKDTDLNKLFIYNNSVWVDLLNSETVCDGDFDVYVDVNGDDSTGDGSQTSPYQTITKALSVCPSYCTGSINLHLGAGDFTYDAEEFNTLLSKIQHATSINIYGVTTQIDSIHLERDSNKFSYYTFSNYDTSIDFNKKFVKTYWAGDEFYNPIINWDSTTETANIPINSPTNDYDVYEFNTRLLPTTTKPVVEIIGSTSYLLFSNLVIDSDKSVELGNNKAIGFVNSRGVHFKVAWLNIKTGDHTQMLVDTNISNHSRAVLVSEEAREPKLSTVAIVNDSANNRTGIGIEFRDSYMRNVIISNFQDAITYKKSSTPTSNDTDYLPDDPNSFLSVRNVTNVFRIEVPSVSLIDFVAIPKGLVCVDYDYLFSFKNDDVLKGLDVNIADIAGDSPSVAWFNTDTYKVLDEQVVEKVLIPGISSAPVLEVTTTERNNLPTAYEGRIVKDTDEDKLYIYFRGEWVNLLNELEVYNGDITLYVDINGSDSTGDGSQANPYATIKKAYDSLPRVVVGNVTINLGAGSFDLPDLTTPKFSNKFYLTGTTTDLNSDFNLSQASTGSPYEYDVDVDYDYNDKFITDGSKFYTVVSYDSSTLRLVLSSPSRTNGTYHVHSVDTTINVTNDLEINMSCEQAFLSKFKLTSNGVTSYFNSRTQTIKKLYLDSFYFDHNGYFKANGLTLRYCVLRNSNSSTYGLYVEDSIKPVFLYHAGVVYTGSGTNARAGIISGRGVNGSFLVKNYAFGLMLASYAGIYPNLTDATHSYAIHMENVDNAFRVLSESVTINTEESFFLRNVTNLLNIDDEDYLINLKIIISNIDGDTPTNIINPSNNIDEYKLFDEQLVAKVILPTKSSSDVLELTTTERNNLQTVYEGRIVKDTDDSKLYVYKNGVWEELGSGSSSSDTLYTADGSLTGDRSLDGDNYLLAFNNLGGFDFGGSDGAMGFSYHAELENMEFKVSSIPDNRHTVLDFDFENINIGFYDDDTGGVCRISLGDSGIRVLDSENNMGMYYSADYSANFVDRSLVDKAYVDNTVGSSTSNLVPYSGATQDVDLGAHNLVTSGTVDGVDVSDFKVAYDAHAANTSNPHQVTFTQAVAADSGTDITAAECETLTDGSNADALHTHTIPEVNHVKVSSNDSTGDFLFNKVVGVSGKVVVTELNDGSDEDLQINIGGDVFDKTVDDLDDVSDGATYGRVKNTNLTSNEVDHTKILNIGSYSHPEIDSHIDDTGNPHDTSMVNLIDTSISNLSDYQTLVYDATTSKWVNSNRGKIVQVYSSVSYNIDDSGDFILRMNEEEFKDDIYVHSNSTNNSRVSVKETGVYKVTYSVNTENATSGWGSYEANLKCWVRKNGSTNLARSTSYSYNYDDTYKYSTNTASFFIKLDANDYLEVLARQMASNSESDTIANEVWFMIERVR